MLIVVAPKQRRVEAKARGEPSPRPGRMWAFREGLGLLIDTLTSHLSRPIVAGVNVRRVEEVASVKKIVA